MLTPMILRTVPLWPQHLQDTALTKVLITHASSPSYENVFIDPQMFRECCWHLSMRGSVGETGLHVCFLVPSSLHMELAKRMVAKFPKLINDIYISEEYYGENVLHMATVNEDPAMVKYLLDAGVNFQVKIWEKKISVMKMYFLARKRGCVHLTLSSITSSFQSIIADH